MRSLRKDSQLSICLKNCRFGIFIKEIFTNISTEMQCIFPDIVLIITPSSTFLRQHLAIRSRRSAPPLTITQSNAYINFLISNPILYLPSRQCNPGQTFR